MKKDVKEEIHYKDCTIVNGWVDLTCRIMGKVKTTIEKNSEEE